MKSSPKFSQISGAFEREVSLGTRLPSSVLERLGFLRELSIGGRGSLVQPGKAQEEWLSPLVMTF